jgi:hypothetical protein
MRLRRRQPPTPPPTLDERTVLLLLVGRDKTDLRRGPFVRQLLFTSPRPDNDRRLAALWTTHARFLRAEATRRGIPRPDDGFFGERAVAMVARYDGTAPVA